MKYTSVFICLKTMLTYNPDTSTQVSKTALGTEMYQCMNQKNWQGSRLADNNKLIENAQTKTLDCSLNLACDCTS